MAFRNLKIQGRYDGGNLVEHVEECADIRGRVGNFVGVCSCPLWFRIACDFRPIVEVVT